MTKELDRVKLELKLLGIDTFFPEVSESVQFKRWFTIISPTTCIECLSNHMKIVYVFDLNEPPIHPNCHCSLLAIYAITVGTATMNGLFGADAWVKNYGELPLDYINKKTAEKSGWKSMKGNLQEVIPKAIIGGDIFENSKGILPSEHNRIWYEADINYTGGYRNGHRLLYSNDGLLFVTYDHYRTFYEVK